MVLRELSTLFQLRFYGRDQEKCHDATEKLQEASENDFWLFFQRALRWKQYTWVHKYIGISPRDTIDHEKASYTLGKDDLE